MIAAHDRYEHSALLHSGPAHLARALAPSVREGLDRGEAVLVCLDEPRRAALAAGLGAAGEAVTYIEQGTRYERPPVAMATLHRFTAGALAAGAPAVWSIGAIDMTGTAADDQWIRYESAVDDVLGHLPLRAVCAFDVDRVPSAVLDSVQRAHRHLRHGDGPRQASMAHAGDVVVDRATRASLGAATLAVPSLEVEVADVAAIREAVLAAAGDVLGPERRQDLALVVSEMATNAVRHGRPPACLRAWRRTAGVVVQAVDHGDGIADPYADLRPPPGGENGYGLWLIGQLADRMAVERRDGATVVTAELT